ncbi:MAG: hypothetical protein IIZ38_13925 [Sphingomonas sp.]|uniref:hypothetical protein n=1 Tax=Sphingomonas sp. TaxID=28214 RepID=UPI0025DC7C59|nr:hypothetical protein [Sphingomonas sp.]MBQ1499406.1 hypothetical protein [Sphingomonas sp.]
MKFLRKLFGGAPEREEDRFAERLLQALKEAIPSFAVEYDPVAFELRHGRKEDTRKTFLHNSFIEYQRLPAKDRGKHIANLVGFILDSERPQPRGDAALDMLLPVLRARADMLVATTGISGDFPHQNSARPFCDTMLLMLALDSPNSIRLVTDELLADLGVSFDDALGLAVAHLDEREHKFGPLADGTFVSLCEDYYDASRLLLPDLISQLPVKGNPVAIVESRSAILVTGSEDRDGLRMIAEYAWQDFPENERAVSLTPIEYRDGAWRVFPMGPDHPQALRNLVQYQRAWSYGASSDALQERLGDNLYVAGVILLEQDGIAATLASWARNVATACPMVDALIIEGDDEFPEITRRLQDVIATCGPFDGVEEMPYPPRLRLPPMLDREARRRLTDDYPHYAPFGAQHG